MLCFAYQLSLTIHFLVPIPTFLTRYEGTDTVGITELIDVNSIKRIDDILSVSMRYDFADIIWEPPYDAPLEFKIECYLYNCKTHQGNAVALMNFDSEGRVTDSL